MTVYTSMHVFKACAFGSPVPTFLPSVGGSVYYGDMVVRKVPAYNNEFTSSSLLVGQVVDKVS
jgi:hypothetical protein